LLKSPPNGHPLLSPSTTLQDHAWRHDHLRAGALRVKMRGLLTDTRELARKLATLESELKSRLDTHEVAITDVLQRIMQLIDPPPAPVIPDKQMGFHTTLPKPVEP